MPHPKRDERLSRSAGILIATLVRYPEVSTVRYEPHTQSIRLGLLLQLELAELDWQTLSDALFDTLDVYLLLSQRVPTVLEVVREVFGELTAVTITRDVPTFSPEEAYTLIEFFKERFPGRVVSEAIEFGTEEDWIAQEEMIEDMLAQMENSRPGRNLIAIREDGRLMVFNK